MLRLWRFYIKIDEAERRISDILHLNQYYWFKYKTRISSLPQLVMEKIKNE